MSKFEQHIRDYYFERQGINFFTTEFGFAGWRIIDGDFYIEELYTEPRTSYRDSFRMFRDIFTLARTNSCKRIIGGNDNTLSTYEEIKALHKFFGAYYSGQSNGSVELWMKDLK